MTVVTTRIFCCCIPVRAGTVLIAILGLLGGGVLAVLGGLNAHNIKGSKVSAGITIAIYGLLALVSLVGLIGAIARKLALVKVYFAMLLAHLMFNLGVGIYALFRIFRDGHVFVDNCVAANPTVTNATKVCFEGLRVIKGVSVSLFIVFLLIEIWGCVIVSNYAGQLADENAVEGVVKDTEAW